MEQRKADRKKQQENKPIFYSKEQILKSERYADRRDILQVLLSDNGKYTLAETDTLLDQYGKGMVK